MQIINDTEVFEPNECFFCVTDDVENPGGTLVCITNKEYWNEEHCLSDGIGPHSFSRDLMRQMNTNGISNAMEAMWSSEDSINRVRSLMLSLGFEESEEMRLAVEEWNRQ